MDSPQRLMPMRNRLLAVFAALTLIATACGSTTSATVEAGGPERTTSSALVATTEVNNSGNKTGTGGDEEIRVPSRAGLGSVFGDASVEEAAAEPDECFDEECDDNGGDVEIPDEPQDPNPTTTRARLD
ncbi:MAG: hypothetical protein ACI91O_001383 [Candidatus Poriferisodalaceae bacterium]|jgi:hypothetical protein